MAERGNSKRESGKAEVVDFGGETLDLSAPPIHDCWKLIGVAGNGTCRELARYIHCRNCPVYSAAGVQLLDRPLPSDYRWERAEHYAKSNAEKRKGGNAEISALQHFNISVVPRESRVSVVIFRLGPEWLALPAGAFQEVAERRALHTLPHRRHGIVLGLVNVRGELLICVSVARLLGLEASPLKVESYKLKVRGGQPATFNEQPGTAQAIFERLLVTNWAGQRLVFPADEVHGLVRLQRQELQAAPATVARSAQTYTRGVFNWRGGPSGEVRTVGLLEAEPLFAALNRSLS